MSERAANVANAYWANFAKTGDPNGFGLPHWPGYDLKEDHLLLFRADGVAAGGAGPLKARLDLTAAAADQKDP